MTTDEYKIEMLNNIERSMASIVEYFPHRDFGWIINIPYRNMLYNIQWLDSQLRDVFKKETSDPERKNHYVHKNERDRFGGFIRITPVVEIKCSFNNQIITLESLTEQQIEFFMLLISGIKTNVINSFKNGIEYEADWINVLYDFNAIDKFERQRVKGWILNDCR